ncbi:MAG TPA: hypothetical protein VIM56_11450 [Rhizomicrobium sp.]
MKEPVTPKPKKKPNAAEKKELLSGEMRLFVREYGRKSQKGIEPNDRKYSRKVEKKIRKHIKPETLDALLRDDDD